MTLNNVLETLLYVQQVREESHNPDLHWREREAANEQIWATLDALTNEVRHALQAEAN